MPFNLYPTRPLSRNWLFLPLYLGGIPLAAQSPCPPRSAQEISAGWRSYRADSVAAAEAAFTRADQQCRGNLDAKVGLGYTALRRDALLRADSLFRLVTRRDPQNGDAWGGLALAAERRGDVATAVLAARRAVALHPADSVSRAVLHRLAPNWDRAEITRRPRPRTLQLVSRTRGTGFEILTTGQWRPIYIKGVNLGAALPGKYPSQFPVDSAFYAGWIAQMAAMNANAVRLYTILPPEFYRALGAWNRGNPARLVWLIHGVWTELPPGNDFNHPGWKADFQGEMQRVVDLVHGSAQITVTPGHAGGRYDADVSRWTLAYIIGREWEPFAVKAFDSTHPGVSAFEGTYLRAARAPAADRWMAEMAEHLLAYEVERYNAIRPIAYTNWPTLDPLTHPTEATTAEEAAWRRHFGRPDNVNREYENDAIGLDPSLITPTARNPAGWFASYHAYPYYPDFMLYDPGYGKASSSEGASSYFGYLRDLVRHHSGIPVLIAEYGVPSSRGVAHLQPQGWHHGGHDEEAMARIDARLTREIRESGAAGGILFAWIDEWFKKNWVVVDLEIPSEHTRLWHNVMDAEQHYGMIGMYAGDSAATPRLGGSTRQWLAGDVIYQERPASPSDPATLRAQANESYLYITALFPGLTGRAFPWDSLGVMLAIDTWLPAVGQHRLLPQGLLESETGFEFLVHLRNPDDGEIRILPEYNPYGGAPDTSGDDLGRFYHRPVTIRDRHDGIFDSMFVGINRARYGRDGTFYPALGVNRGRLRYGPETASSLADWYYDESSGMLQIRLAWALLNVTDPSTRTILYETAARDSFGTVTAKGFRFGLLTYRKGTTPTLGGALPRPVHGARWKADTFRSWAWSGWESPRWHSHPKPAYRVMRETWDSLR